MSTPGSTGHLLNVTRAASIGEIEPTQWEPIAARARLYQSHSWLSWAEAYYRLPTCYLLAADAEGSLLGAVVTYLMREVPDRLTTWYDPVRLFLAPHGAGCGAAERWFPVLLIGGCSGYHSEILLAPWLGTPDRQAVVAALLADCRRLAVEQNAGSLAFLYAPPHQAEAVSRAFGPTARLIPTSAEAVIEFRPGENGFDDYLCRFASARRRNLRKETTNFTAAGSRVGEHRLGDVLNRAIPLLGAHQRKYGDPVTDEQIGEYLTLQDAYLGSQSVVFTDERDDQINGFALCYVHGDVLYGRAAGFDPQRAAPYSYFNVAIYASIRHALEHGYAAFDLGAGSYRAKLWRGAHNRALWSAVVPPMPGEPAWNAALNLPSPQAVDAGCA